MDKKLNLENPTTFNEKLQWLKINDRNSKYIKMVDKYEAKKYISSIIGEEYIIPTLGVWDKFDDINFDSLPNQFVLKCTHDSGGVVIVKDKSKMDFDKARKKIAKSLKKNFYWRGREWPYKRIKPRIIAEEYLVDESGVELKDYKVMCFNGKVKCTFVCSNRKQGLNIDIYDENWNLMPFERLNHPQSGNLIKKPENYDLMVKMAEKLSENIPFLRIDFYNINGKLYVGELTFYPANGMEGFKPETFDEIMGSWLNLPLN